MFTDKDRIQTEEKTATESTNEDALLNAYFPYNSVRKDPFTNFKQDADQPIWDPRAYFLQVLQHQSSQVSKEWQFLVYEIDHIMSGYGNLLTLPYSRQLEAVQEDLQQAIEILERLEARLCETTLVWQEFIQNDLTLFEGILEGGQDDVVLGFPQIALSEIDKSFGVLKEQRRKLIALLTKSKSMIKAVSQILRDTKNKW
jgi:hypothetical protein